MEEKNNNHRNTQQDIAIAEIQKDVSYLKTEVNEIKEQVFNHLPSKIDNLNQEWQRYKLSNAKWLISILISILFLLVGTILNFFIK